ncbi:unnamed protein product [Cuscuta campestris]|uniref:DUF4219 domain-containing protein n=1 Tax=Cuscuta campestris TaxID=132261 RepID=A0A484NA86_9ASTE|nr:unnamed protein product [Cuscuta campestris]
MVAAESDESSSSSLDEETLVCIERRAEKSNHEDQWTMSEDDTLCLMAKEDADQEVKTLNKELGILQSKEAVDKLLNTTKKKGREGLGFDPSSSKRKGRTTVISPKPTAEPNKQKGIGEGQSTSRPPLFDGTNYSYWKERMRIYIRSTNFQLWLVIKNGEEIPMKKVGETTVPKTENEFDAKDIKKIENYAKAINMLYCAVNPDDYRKISCCTTAKEMWDKLEVTYEGTDQVREAKIDFLTQEYEMFRMKEGEKIDDMFDRFSKIINDLHALKKTYTNKDLAKHGKDKPGFKKQRAYISWGGDSGDESTDQEEDEAANLCLMAHEDQSDDVQETSHRWARSFCLVVILHQGSNSDGWNSPSLFGMVLESGLAEEPLTHRWENLPIAG